MPKITVVMPAHNSSEFIARAIQSTLRALPRDSEIVVFDDASEDRTAEIAEMFPRCRVIRSEVNVGSGTARRSAVAASDSEFVANMDADDVCLPWRFALQLQQIGQADMVFSGSLSFESGRPTTVHPRQPLPSGPDTARLELLLANPFAHSSMLCRRTSLTRVGNYSEMRRAQDYELWLRGAARGLRLVKHAVPTYLYRRSPFQVSAVDEDHRRQVSESREIAKAFIELYQRETGSELAAQSCGAMNRELAAEISAWQIHAINSFHGPRRTYYIRLNKRGKIFLPVVAKAY